MNCKDVDTLLHIRRTLARCHHIIGLELGIHVEKHEIEYAIFEIDKMLTTHYIQADMVALKAVEDANGVAPKGIEEI